MIGFVVASVCALPFIVLIAEVSAGLRAVRNTQVDADPALRITVLIPAHDEASGIGDTIRAVQATAPPNAAIMVVADNCTDETAAIARAAGAIVCERTDTLRLGKGYALDFGRDGLRPAPPDVVIVLDADCRPHDDTIARIAALAASTRRPVQAINLVDPPIDRDALGRVSTFAFRVKNLVRQRGLQRIAATCVLTGTGMAIPWSLFDKAPLATADSVEDLALGLNFVMNQAAPLLCTGTLVTSPSPAADAAVAQRTRWEHGFLTTAMRIAPRLFAVGLRQKNWQAFWLGLHLIVPPLALLIMLGAVIAIGLAVMAPAAALFFAAVYLTALLTVFAAWFAEGRTVLPARLLFRIPGYILWKLPIYLRLMRGADRRWTRTDRK